jgi:hypothetical protein
MKGGRRLVLNVLDARHEAADPVQQLVIAT